jgi:hypothetical protein
MTKHCNYDLLSSCLKDFVIMGNNDACLLGTAAFAARLSL